jgi:hypothetical protein
MGRSEFEDPKLAEVKAILARLQRLSPDTEQDDLDIAQEVPDGPVFMPPISAPRPLWDAVSPAPIAVEPAPAAPRHERSPARLGAVLLAGCATAAIVLLATRSLWLPQPPSQPIAVTAPAKPAEPDPMPRQAKASALPVAAAGSAPAAASHPSAPPPEMNTGSGAATTAPETTAAVTPSGHAADKAALQLASRLISAGRVAAGRAELLRIAPQNSADVAWALARSFDPKFIGPIENADARPDIDEAAKWYRRWHALAIEQGMIADSVSIERIIQSMRQ